MPARFHCTFLGALSSLEIAALILILPGTQGKREAGELKTVPGQGKKKEIKKKTHAHLRPGSAAAGWNNSPLTSLDVYWSWARMAAGGAPSLWNLNFGATAQGKGVSSGGSNRVKTATGGTRVDSFQEVERIKKGEGAMEQRRGLPN